MNDLFHIDGGPLHPLFDGIVSVWEPLDRLDAYFEGYRFASPFIAPQGVFIEAAESIAVGRNVSIEPGAFIRGPCIIGDGSIIRHGAYVRGHVVLGEGCVIGHATEVKRSIFLPGAKAAHFNYVGDSILGRGVNLGAGAICANMRFDKGEVAGGRTKLGAAIGDGAQVGCNAVLAPGSCIKRGKWVR